MKMHNFTIRGNCLEIVGRIERRGNKPVTVYDLEFPCGMDNLSLKELREAIRRIEEDIDEMFYYSNDIKNAPLRQFEETWREESEDDAHGA